MNLTKKLFIAIMTMALLVITFTTSTFAWFTLGTTGKIENVEVNVMAGKGMELSTNGASWVNNLKFDANSIDFKDLTSSNGVILKDKLDTDTATASKDTDYLELKIYVRVTKDNISSVQLKSVSGIDRVFGENDGWVADVNFGGETFTDQTTAFTQGTKYHFDPINAVKVSFTANADTTAKFIYGYENSNSYGTAAANGIAKAYAEAKGYEDIPDTVSLPTDGYVTYTKDANASADSNGYVKYDQYTTDKKDVLVSSDFGTFENKIGLTTVENPDNTNYLYATLTIRIWLEGWDADCINAILDGETKLSFALEAIEAQSNQNSGNEQSNG